MIRIVGVHDPGDYRAHYGTGGGAQDDGRLISSWAAHLAGEGKVELRQRLPALFPGVCRVYLPSGHTRDRRWAHFVDREV